MVEQNRPVAVSMAAGPEAGLAVLEGVAETPALEGYHLVPGGDRGWASSTGSD
jgi:predicted RNA polymerase sigma factor